MTILAPDPLTELSDLVADELYLEGEWSPATANDRCAAYARLVIRLGLTTADPELADLVATEGLEGEWSPETATDRCLAYADALLSLVAA